MRLIIDDMKLTDIRIVSREIIDFLKNLGYGVDNFQEIRDNNQKLKGIEYKLYRINE